MEAAGLSETFAPITKLHGVMFQSTVVSVAIAMTISDFTRHNDFLKVFFIQNSASSYCILRSCASSSGPFYPLQLK
jgi:hypothetical protein